MSNEIVNYEERLAAMAQAAQASERPSAGQISVRAGQLTYNGQPVAGNQLDAIVIASTHANLYYEGVFDPDVQTNPVCYAYSPDGKTMVPHPSASKPQHTDCATCPHNQWGSADRGKGKACKNSRHLALIPASTTPENVLSSEQAVLKLPVMSVQNWATYVDKCATMYQRPPLGLITQIGTVPDARSQFKVTFQAQDKVSTEMLGALLQLSEGAARMLEREYDANPDLPKPPDKGNKLRGGK